ncbi:hypothetical protein INS49_003639 [Diaporthe citri]|uniref:uncharacterized protein n=1 Tax=Diaporthe citri TaxID=83186 RepID=UPI001C7E4996|nr:uncharacterized protein INS49_003639 [Diaporthe citri]KAG6355676.1 hypothetical protein INS49_003639 [Diaporthe citri]
MPTLVIPVRAYLHRTPAARARPWGDPGATLELLGQVGLPLLELPCGSELPRGGQCLPRDRTCPIEDRREHDIAVEPRLIVSKPLQKRPTPAYLTAYLHILPSCDATVL